jgi:hypothetical protein
MKTPEPMMLPATMRVAGMTPIFFDDVLIVFLAADFPGIFFGEDDRFVL